MRMTRLRLIVIVLLLLSLAFLGCSGTTTNSSAKLTSIEVTPTNPSIAKGTSQQLTATGIYSDNTTKDLTGSVTWYTSDAAVATIDNTGWVTAGATGAVAISASNGRSMTGTITGTTLLTVTPATLVSIAVNPTNPSIAKGTAQQFTATGTFSDNTTQDLTGSATWASANTSVATVNNGGMAASVQPGSSDISAVYGGKSAATTLTVTPATLVSIAVTPTNPSIVKGTTRQFAATGTYTDNSTQDLTASASWSSSNTGVATISDSTGSKGLAASASVGTTTITAAYSGKNETTTLTVTAPTLASITVTPADPSIALGTTKQFTATGTYSDSTTQDLTTSVTWSSSSPGVAAVSNAAGTKGLATSVTTGSTTITATSGSVSGYTTLSVTPAQLTSIAITPTNPQIAKGTTKQFTATGTYTDASTQDLTTSATWSSSSTGIATISNAAGSKGLATSVATGSTTITAISGIVSGTTTLTITSANLTSIAVTPANPTVAMGTTKQFTATGTYTDSSTQDLSSSATWSSSSSGVATISNAAGSKGLLTPVSAGSVIVSAILSSVTGTTSATITSISLGEAVDATSLTWTAGGNASWFGQSATSYNGGDAAQSGGIVDSQISSVQTTVNGPGSLTFYWKVSSESGYDYLNFYIDGALQTGSISGEVAWTQKTFSIVSGSHTLKWEYAKDDSISEGLDAAWLDEVVFSQTTAPTSGKIIFSKQEPAGYYDLWMMNPDSTNQQRLTDEAKNGLDSLNPTVFPDGKKVLFARNYNIFVLDTATLQATALTTDGASGTYAYGSPHLSPDGTKIAYSRGQSIAGSCSACTTYEIWIMNADGTNKTQMTNNSYRDGEALFSPDGTKLLLTHYQGAPSSDCCNETDVYIMDIATKVETKLYGTTGYDWGIAWSSAGILIRSSDPNYVILRIQSDGTGLTTLFDATKQVVTVTYSPDGTKLVYASDISGSYNLYVSNADGTSPVQITNSVTVYGDYSAWGNVQSAVKIAFVKSNDIWMTNDHGNSPVNITNSAEIETTPRLSPDASKIAYLSDQSGRYEIWIMNADGVNKTQITNNNTTYQVTPGDTPAWSPDGQWLYFGSAGAGDGEVWKIKTDGTGLTQLTNVSGYNTQSFDISLDGSKVCFDRGVQGNGYSNQLYTANADFTSPIVRQASNAPHRSQFSPDGTKIVYQAASGGQPGTHIVNADGTNDVFVTSSIHAGWHPDGTKLLITEGGNLYWINIDGTNQSLVTTGADWQASAK